MKINHSILFMFALLISGLNSNAATLIVSSNFPQPAGVYATIQLAYNAASPGDTIVITPAEGEYAGITIAKKIHIVGYGWERQSVSVPTTKTGSITCNAGAQGSSITGLEVNGVFAINTSNITIQRNKCQRIGVNYSCINIVIKQNYISSPFVNNSYDEDGSIVFIYGGAQVVLLNNIIINTGLTARYSNGISAEYATTTIIYNNVIKATSDAIMLVKSGDNCATHTIKNNIVLNGNIVGTNELYISNNIGNSTQFATTNNNQQNVDMTTVFVDPENLNFHLLEESPAIGAGFEGVDCGIYGGTFPFVDKGRSWLPIISEIEVPSMINAADGLNIGIKAKSGK